MKSSNAMKQALVAGLFLLASAAFADGTARAFPMPSIDGKTVAISEGQKSFRLPIRFQKVADFYRAQFADPKEVQLTATGTSPERTLLLTNKRKGDTWSKAVVREGEIETVIEVTPVLRMGAETVNGNGKPLVEFVISRDPQAAKAAADIDHTTR
jgi:hypothetical protein